MRVFLDQRQPNAMRHAQVSEPNQMVCRYLGVNHHGSPTCNRPNAVFNTALLESFAIGGMSTGITELMLYKLGQNKAGAVVKSAGLSREAIVRTQTELMREVRNSLAAGAYRSCQRGVTIAAQSLLQHNRHGKI